MGDEELRAAEDEAVAPPPRRQGYAVGAEAGTGLQEGQGHDDLSLRDARQEALLLLRAPRLQDGKGPQDDGGDEGPRHQERKSTRLNSSHGYISYAVFCLKKN